MSQFISHSINSVVVQFLSFAISVVSTIITARALGPDGKGLLTLAIMIPMLAVTFGRMGIGHAANYLAPKISSDELISNVALSSAALSLTAMVLALPATYCLKDIFFRDLTHQTIFLVVLVIPLYMLYNHLTSLIQALYEIRFRNFILLVQSLTNLLLLVILVIIAKIGLIGAIIAAIGAISFSVVLSSLFLIKKTRVKQPAINAKVISGLFRYGFKTHIGNVLKDLSYRVDILIISYFLPASSVGFYVAAVNLAEIVLKIPDAIGAVLLPRVASIGAESAKKLTPAVSRMVFLMVSLMAVGILLFSQKIVVFLLGVRFQPSNLALVLLMPGMISLTVWKIIATDLIAEGYSAQYSLTALVSLLVMIILDLLLIPRYGIGGAALATTAAYIAATVSIICFYTRYARLSFGELLIPSRSDLSIYRSMLRLLPLKILR